MFNEHFAEQYNICQGFLPVAMNTAANNGDWVSMRDYERCAIVIFKAVGTNGDDPTIVLKQATAVAGTGSKALAFSSVYKKQAASNLLATGAFVLSTSAAPASNDTFATGSWTNSDLAEQAAIIVIDVKAEDLDAHNDFDCIQVSIADIGTNAQLGCALYFLGNPRYQKSLLNSGIID